MLRDLLSSGLETAPDAEALVSADERWSWRELEQASERLAANLLGIGLHAGDRVASLMPNCSALVIHYLACIKAGLVATPLNYRYMAPEIDHALALSGASVLLTHVEREADVAASDHAVRLPLGLIRYKADDDTGLTFATLIEREPPGRELPDPSPEAPGFIFFTSGSTGKAKGVTHSFETIGWQAASVAPALEYAPGDSYLAGSSISHIGGFGFVIGSLAAGIRVIIPKGYEDTADLLSLIRTERPTVVWMLPAAAIRLVRESGARPRDLSSIRLFGSGGDKVPAELEREFTELTGIPIDETWGMTEVGHATISPPSDEVRLGSVGRPYHGFTASIRDEQGNELPVGSQGRLWIKTPCAMIGYWRDPEATAAAFNEGWLDTGDEMRADEDGYLWFCGRKKQIIVHDGSNISPQDVEGALLEHPTVTGAGVIGVHDPLHGEDVRAYVTLREDTEPPSAGELLGFARKRVGYKAPEEIVVLEEMPLTPVGKMDRTALKRIAKARLVRDHL